MLVRQANGRLEPPKPDPFAQTPRRKRTQDGAEAAPGGSDGRESWVGIEGVPRARAKLPWDDPTASARGDIRHLAVFFPAKLARNVEGGIAEADNERPLAAQIKRLGGIDIILRMNFDAGEAPGRSWVRPCRIPV